MKEEEISMTSAGRNGIEKQKRINYFQSLSVNDLYKKHLVADKHKLTELVKPIEVVRDPSLQEKLSRHSILHGVTFKYGTKENFLKTFSFLIFLIDVYNYSHFPLRPASATA